MRQDVRTVRDDLHVTELAQLPQELSDQDLAAAVRYWRRHKHVVSGKVIVAMFEAELAKRDQKRVGDGQHVPNGK